MRINRFLSQAGLGSRRAVEALVRDGRVRVNGRTVTGLSVQIDPQQDRVDVDGERAVAAPPGRLFALHKPLGIVSSFRAQGDSGSLADLLPRALRHGRLFHVGLLERDSSGLLLLTDDGELAQLVLHPAHPVWKEYDVNVDRALGKTELAALERARIVLDGRPCGPVRVQPGRGLGGTAYRLWLRGGRNRQIHRMLEALGRRVQRLHRVAIGPLRLGSLPPGALRAVTPNERDALVAAARAPEPQHARRSAARPSGHSRAPGGPRRD